MTKMVRTCNKMQPGENNRVTEWRTEEIRTRGRPRNTWRDGIAKDLESMDVRIITHACLKKKNWRRIVKTAKLQLTTKNMV